MNGSETTVELSRLMQRLLALHHDDSGGLPVREHDPDWLSDCEKGEPDARGRVAWRPVAREPRGTLEAVGRGLETSIHPDISAFYGSYWCDSFEAQTDDGRLTLIQVWNEDDFDRLCENILGHAVSKRRARAPLTIFIACTDEQELVLSVENDTGRVVLENPGERPVRVVADSLPVFLQRVEPVLGPRLD